MESEPLFLANMFYTSRPALHLPYEAHAVNRQHTRATWYRPKPYRCGRSGSSLVPKTEQAVAMLLTPQEPKCFCQTADDVHRTGVWWWRGGVHSSYGEWAVDYRPTYVRHAGAFSASILLFPRNFHNSCRSCQLSHHPLTEDDDEEEVTARHRGANALPVTSVAAALSCVLSRKAPDCE